MKTRKILAASTAALLAFGATAVIASAATSLETGTTVDSNVKGAIDAGATGTYTFTNYKDWKLAADGETAIADSEGDVTTVDAGKEVIKGLLDAAKDTSLKHGDGAVSASISVANAMKLNGKYAFKVEEKSAEEGEDEDKTEIGDDSDLKKTGVNADALKKLGNTKSGEIRVFNIIVGKDGKANNADGKVTLDVTVTGTFKGAKVYHVDSDGNLQLVKSSTDPDFDSNYTTTFTTSTFSPFIVTTADLKVTAAPADESSDASDTSGATSTNPETGIALAIAPVVLAAGAVAVVALKKKH